MLLNRSQISKVLLLSQYMLESKTLEECWQNVCNCLYDDDFHNVAIFHIDRISQPIIKARDVNCAASLTEMGSPYKQDKLWKLSFNTLDNYLLHIEKKRTFVQGELEFIQLICNMLELRWRFQLPLPRQKMAEVTISQIDTTSRKDLTHQYPDIIGDSPVLMRVLSILDKIVDTEIPVLIQGESGTGKELLAQAIHQYSRRSKCPFISENCAAIPETLLESELFGYVRGAFTGATHDKQGLFVMADKGSLFLDEVGDMSLNMQKKVLRALQNGEIRPVGSSQSRQVDVRIVAATNKDLKDAMEHGRFREDLYYRLNVVRLVSPPLRERGQDILLLFDYFVQRTAQKMNLGPIRVTDDAKQLLLKYQWPGNIRELQNEVQRILTLVEGNTITIQSLSPEILTDKFG